MSVLKGYLKKKREYLFEVVNTFYIAQCAYQGIRPYLYIRYFHIYWTPKGGTERSSLTFYLFIYLCIYLFIYLIFLLILFGILGTVYLNSKINLTNPHILHVSWDLRHWCIEYRFLREHTLWIVCYNGIYDFFYCGLYFNIL